MTATEFSQILLNQDAFLHQPSNFLEKELEKFPYCQPLRFLLLKKDYLENGQASREKLNLASAYAADRSFLYQYLLPDETSDSVSIDSKSSLIPETSDDKDSDNLAEEKVESQENQITDNIKQESTETISNTSDEKQPDTYDQVPEENLIADEPEYLSDSEMEHPVSEEKQPEQLKPEESASDEGLENESLESEKGIGIPDEITVDLTLDENLDDISIDKQTIEGGIELLLEQSQKLSTDSEKESTEQSSTSPDHSDSEVLDIQSLEIDELDENTSDIQDLNLELDAEGNLDLSGAELSEEAENDPPSDASDDAEIKKKEHKSGQKVKPVYRKSPKSNIEEVSPFLQWLESLPAVQNESQHVETESIPVESDNQVSEPEYEDDPDQSNLEEVTTLAKSSVSEDHTAISETLANILVVQGNKEKAEEMYRLLGLKFPEKSTYFAGKIENLKKS